MESGSLTEQHCEERAGESWHNANELVGGEREKGGEKE